MIRIFIDCNVNFFSNLIIVIEDQKPNFVDS